MEVIGASGRPGVPSLDASGRELWMYLSIAFFPIVVAAVLIVVLGRDGLANSPFYFPLYLIGIIAPMIGAITISWQMSGSFGAVRRLFRRPVGVRTTVVGTAGVAISVAGTTVLLGPLLGADLSLLSGSTALVGTATFFLIGGLTEEIGWRGTLLPMLQNRMDVLPAVLSVGVIHALWHVPIQLAVVDSLTAIGISLSAIVGAGVVWGWAFNATERVYAPWIVHVAYNTFSLYTDPARVIAGETTNALLVFIGAWVPAIVIVVATRGQVGVQTEE